MRFTKSLKYNNELLKLKHIIKGNSDKIDATELEREFIRFSKHIEDQKLIVNLKHMYRIEGDEVEHFQDALKALRKKNPADIEEIDISGAFSNGTGKEEMIILSQNQIKSDHYRRTRSYLNPLIEKVYGDGAAMILDFTVNEALCGTVESRRGSVDLDEINLFPERFSSGPYKISIKLDTPKHSVKEYSNLIDRLKQVEDDPKSQLLDNRFLAETTRLGLKLRKRLGSLSRYGVPESDVFSVDSNYAVVRTDKNTQFYLYSDIHNRNICVYFGDSPFDIGEEPKELLVLSGKEHHETLKALLRYDFFRPSQEVLEDRIDAINHLYENIKRNHEQIGTKEDDPFLQLKDELENTKRYFKIEGVESRRHQYVANLPPEALEFVLAPANTDSNDPNSYNPIVTELLSRISWNKVVRNYSNTCKFKHLFDEGDEKRKINMLQDIVSNIHFANQQNNDVNVWLYEQHKGICDKAGIEFHLIE